MKFNGDTCHTSTHSERKEPAGPPSKWPAAQSTQGATLDLGLLLSTVVTVQALFRTSLPILSNKADSLWNA